MILAERNIKPPMKLAFNAPVFSHRSRKLGYICKRCNEISHFMRFFACAGVSCRGFDYLYPVKILTFLSRLAPINVCLPIVLSELDSTEVFFKGAVAISLGFSSTANCPSEIWFSATQELTTWYALCSLFPLPQMVLLSMATVLPSVFTESS